MSSTTTAERLKRLAGGKRSVTTGRRIKTNVNPAGIGARWHPVGMHISSRLRSGGGASLTTG